MRTCFCGQVMPEGRTMEGLRVLGWTFYDGPNFNGTHLVSLTLCPDCTRSRRVKAPDVLDGQEDLFS